MDVHPAPMWPCASRLRPAVKHGDEVLVSRITTLFTR
jgi:hypothetical protein